MDKMILKAYAKVNLGLDVLGRRDDGYHEVRMVMQTVSVYDLLMMHKNAAGTITIRTNLSYLPTGENNLVYKAAQMLRDEFEIKEGLFIRLHKYIPVAAGMAGGSADAAAVLVGMNRMFRLGLTRKQLMERGLKIGADVPFCLVRGTSLSEGIGEKLTRLPAPQPYSVLIAKPRVSVSTKLVYEKYDSCVSVRHPDIDGLIQALQDGSGSGMAAAMGNVLEYVTAEEYPVIGEIKECMLRGGAVGAIMTGSGPTVFGLFEKKKEAERVRDVLRKTEGPKQTYLTEWYNPNSQR